MRSFAIIPAAGTSQRMGQPKLLLPYQGTTVIERVLAAWRASGVDRVVLVVHPQDDRLVALGQAAGVEIVRPDSPPAEMKDSVRLGLERVARENPSASDAWLLAPADMPALTAAAIAGLIRAYRQSLDSPTPAERVWVPRYRGRRGHPVLLAWSLAADVAPLGSHEGLNALVDRNPVHYVETDDASVCDDLDTPEDYARLTRGADS